MIPSICTMTNTSLEGCLMKRFLQCNAYPTMVRTTLLVVLMMNLTTISTVKAGTPKVLRIGEVTYTLPTKSQTGMIGNMEIKAVVVRSKDAVLAVSARSAGDDKDELVFATRFSSAPTTVVTSGRWESSIRRAQWKVLGVLRGPILILHCEPYSDMAPRSVYWISSGGVSSLEWEEGEKTYDVCRLKCSGSEVVGNQPPTFLCERTYDGYSAFISAKTGRRVEFSSLVSEVWECNGNLYGKKVEDYGHGEEESTTTYVTIDTTSGVVSEKKR